MTSNSPKGSPLRTLALNLVRAPLSVWRIAFQDDSPTSDDSSKESPLRKLALDLLRAPMRVWRIVFRNGPPNSDRTRSDFVFNNVFLHIHAVRTHRWSLRWNTTMGLGVAATCIEVEGEVHEAVGRTWDRYQACPGNSLDREGRRL